MMLRYLGAEIIRVLSKRSLYIYFGAIAVVFVLITYIRSGGFNEFTFHVDSNTYFEVLPLFFGGYLFSAVITDDLGSRNLATLIGHGIPRALIVISKLVLMTLFCAVAFGIVPLFMYAVYALLGAPLELSMLGVPYAFALRALLLAVGFSAIACIAAYGIQRTVFAMTLFILLASNFLGSLVLMVLSLDFVQSLAPDLKNFLLVNLSSEIRDGLIHGTSQAAPCIALGVYVIAAACLSVLAFHKKELEF
ncbi:MAG: hypothetical protein LBD25_07265 [Coriobacteriales bacterium]|jgi:ABC-type transport system involved in multi-copper enzyme maturation permease subunit|nr:hypothetical protein [Coriobacteriales bacterium]